MTLKTNIIRKTPTGLIIALAAVVLAVSVTLASIFTQSISVNRLFSVSNLVGDIAVSFDGGADIASYTDSNGYRVSLKPSDPNYIGKLRVAVLYKGMGVGLVRVRITEEWSTTTDGVRTVMPFTLKFPYALASAYSASSGNQAAWYDNREEDHCFYYATPVRCASDSVTKSLSLITGLDTSADLTLADPNADIHVVVQADVVQVNRYPQYWNMTELPWTGGVSLTETTLS